MTQKEISDLAKDIVIAAIQNNLIVRVASVGKGHDEANKETTKLVTDFYEAVYRTIEKVT